MRTEEHFDENVGGNVTWLPRVVVRHFARKDTYAASSPFSVAVFMITMISLSFFYRQEGAFALHLSVERSLSDLSLVERLLIEVRNDF